MVSRANLSGRAPMGGVLGRVYKGPSGPGNVTPPGMEEQARKRGRKVLDGQTPGPIDAGDVPVLGSGAESPATRPRRGRGIFNQAKSAIEQSKAQQAALNVSPVDTTQFGIKESMGDRYVEPATRPALGGPALGGNETTGAPRRRGSEASRSRRIIR